MHATTVCKPPELIKDFYPTIVVSPDMVFIQVNKQDDEDKAIAKAQKDMSDLHAQVVTWMNSRGYLLRKKGVN